MKSEKLRSAQAPETKRNAAKTRARERNFEESALRGEIVW